MVVRRMSLQCASRCRLSELESAPWLNPPRAASSTALSQHGILVCHHMFNLQAVELCRRFVLRALEAALALPLEQSTLLLGDVRSPLFRHDVKLDLDDPLVPLLLAFLASPLGAALAAVVGEDAWLCELSCIITEGGASAQPAHCDTPAAQSDRGLLYTAFIPLQPITESMGPTMIWPGTHTPAFHAELQAGTSDYASRGSLLLQAKPAVCMDLDAGACVLMDSRCWHYGGANVSGRKRCLLVVSFASASEQLPAGSTYSMLPSLVGRHTFRSLRAISRVAEKAPLCDALQSAEAAWHADVAETVHEVPTAARKAGGDTTAAREVARRAGSTDGVGENASDGGNVDGHGHGHGPHDDTGTGSDGGEAAAADVVLLPPPAVAQLLQLARTLPAHEPRAHRCVVALQRVTQRVSDTTAERTNAPRKTPEGTAIATSEAKERAPAASAAAAAAAASADSTAAAASVPVSLSVLRLLHVFRVLGPHMRSSSRWGALQRLADAALAGCKTLGPSTAPDPPAMETPAPQCTPMAAPARSYEMESASWSDGRPDDDLPIAQVSHTGSRPIGLLRLLMQSGLFHSYPAVKRAVSRGSVWIDGVGVGGGGVIPLVQPGMCVSCQPRTVVRRSKADATSAHSRRHTHEGAAAPLHAVLLEAMPEHFATASSVERIVRRRLLAIDGDVVTSANQGVPDGATITLAPNPQPVVVYQRTIEVVFENPHWAVVVKPAGLVMDSSGSGPRSCCTLASVLPHNLRPSSEADALDIPVAVHRLDASVGGLIVVAKTRRAARALEANWSDVRKEYVAIVAGLLGSATGEATRAATLEVARAAREASGSAALTTNAEGAAAVVGAELGAEGVEGAGGAGAAAGQVAESAVTACSSSCPVSRRGVDASGDRALSEGMHECRLPLDGKPCCTHYRTLEVVPSARFGHVCRVALWPLSDRLHQLRRHCAMLGSPIVGDRLYGGDSVRVGQAIYLWAVAIEIADPITAELRTFGVPPPPKFAKLLATERRVHTLRLQGAQDTTGGR